MATLSERLALIIDFDGKSAIKGLEDVAKKSEGASKESRDLSANLTKIGAVGLAASGVAAVGLGKLAMGASDLNEVTSKTKVIFGDAADQVIDFGKNAAKSLGQSERAALEAATGVAQLGKAAGLSGGDLAKFSTDLVGLAGDLASFNNTSPEEAIQALGAALRGESEPIRAYGVLLDDATLKQRALSMGLIETTTGTLPPAIKVQAAYAEILAQTKDAQGDFARTSEGAANQQRILKAEIENLANGIGTGLLPAFTGVVSLGADVVGKLNDMGPAAKTALGTLAAGGTGVVAALSGISLVAGQLAKMKDRFTEVTEAGSRLTTAGKVATGAAVGIGVFAAAVAVVESASQAAKKRVDDFKASMQETGDTASESAARQLFEYVAAHKGVQKALDKSGVTTAELRDAVLQGGAAYDTVRAKLNAYANEEFYKNGKQAEGVRSTNALVSEMYRLREIAAKVTEEERRRKEAQDALNVSSRESIASAVALSGVTDAVAESTDNATLSEEELKEARKAAEEQADRLSKSHKDLADATRDAYRAAQESVDPILRERAANRELEKAAKDVADKTRDAAKAKFEDATKNGEVVEAQDGLITKLTDVAGAYVTAKGKALDSAEGSKLYVDKLTELRDQYGAQLGPAIAIYDELIARIRETNRQQAIANQTAAGYNVGGAAGGMTGGPRMETAAFDAYVPPSMRTTSAAPVTINVTSFDPQAAGRLVVDAIASYERTNGTGWRT